MKENCLWSLVNSYRRSYFVNKIIKNVIDDVREYKRVFGNYVKKI